MSADTRQNAISSLAEACTNGSLLQTGQFPEQYLESERVVDPNSVDGVAFETYCQGILQKLQPARTERDHPVRFVLLNSEDMEGYILPNGEPAVIALSKSLIEFCKGDETPLAWVIGHEYTHLLSQLERQGGHGRKLEEASADFVPLRWMEAAGYSPMGGVEFIARLYLKNGPLSKAAVEKQRITSADATTLMHTLQDPHFRDDHRVAVLADTIGGSDVREGRNSAAMKRVPIPANIRKLVKGAEHTRYIDHLRAKPDYASANPLEQIERLRLHLGDLQPEFPWRAVEMQEALGDAVEEIQNYDWDAIGQDIDEVDEKLAETGVAFIEDLAEMPEAFDVLYPTISRELLQERDAKKPQGPLKDLAVGLQEIITAKDARTFEENYQRIKPLLERYNALPLANLEWPQFKTGLNDSEAVRETAEYLTPVPWENQIRWALAHIERTGDDGPVAMLTRMGIHDERLFKKGSAQMYAELGETMSAGSHFGMPEGYKSGRLKYESYTDETGTSQVFDGFNPSPHTTMAERYLETEHYRWYSASRSGRDVAEKFFDTPGFEPGKGKTANAQNNAINAAGDMSRPILISLWPGRDEEFVATFATRFKEYEASMKTPEILTVNPLRHPQAALVRTILMDAYEYLIPDDYERTNGVLPEAVRTYLREDAKRMLGKSQKTAFEIDEAIDIIEQQIYPCEAHRDRLADRLLNAVQKDTPGAAELMRSFYLGREDGCDYEHIFVKGLLNSPKEKLGSPFWTPIEVQEDDVNSTSYEKKHALKKVFSYEQQMDFMLRENIIKPDSVMRHSENQAYPTDNIEFWEYIFFNSRVDWNLLSVSELLDMESACEAATAKGFTGHREIISQLYDTKLEHPGYEKLNRNYIEFGQSAPNAGGGLEATDQTTGAENLLGIGTIDPTHDFAEKDASEKSIEDAASIRQRQEEEAEEEKYGGPEAVDYDDDDDLEADEPYSLEDGPPVVLNVREGITSSDFLLKNSMAFSKGGALSLKALREIDKTLTKADDYTGDSLDLARMLTIVDRYELISSYEKLQLFKQRTLEAISEEPNLEKRRQAIDHILIHCNLKDFGLRKKFISGWVELLQEDLTKKGLPAIDDSSPEFAEGMKEAIAGVRLLGSSTSRYEILNELSVRLETQREASRLVKDVLYSSDARNIEETENTINFGEGAISITDANPPLRRAIVKFLSREPEPELTNETAKATRLYMIQANQVGRSVYGPSSRISDDKLKTSLLRYHDNFWNMALPTRALIMSQLLLPGHERDFEQLSTAREALPEENSAPLPNKILNPLAKRQFADAFETVSDTLFPTGTPHSDEAKILLQAYDTMLERTGRIHVRPVLLAVMMSASQQSQQQRAVSVGERLALVLEMMGTAEIKTGQMAGSNNNTPKDIAEGLQRLKDRAAEPTRWEMWDMIDESVPPALQSRFGHVGKVLGSASMYITLDVEMKPGEAARDADSDMVLSLQRPHAKAQAQQGFSMLDEFVKVLAEQEEQITPEFAKNLHEMARQAQEMVAIETDAEIGATQVMAAEQLKAGKTVRIKHRDGEQTIQFNHATWTDYGEGFRLMNKMQGNNFNEALGIQHFRRNENGSLEVTDKVHGKQVYATEDALPEDLRQRLDEKRQYAAAHWMLGAANILRGGPLDQDIHGGNFKIDPGTHSINSFDDGMIHATRDAKNKVIITVPSEDDLQQLGKTICAALDALRSDSPKPIAEVISDSMDEIRRARGGEVPVHLLRVERTLLSMNDSGTYLGKEQMGEMLLSLYKAKQMHPIIQQMVSKHIGYVGQAAVATMKTPYSLQDAEQRGATLTPPKQWKATPKPVDNTKPDTSSTETQEWSASNDLPSLPAITQIRSIASQSFDYGPH